MKTSDLSSKSSFSSLNTQESNKGTAQENAPKSSISTPSSGGVAQMSPLNKLKSVAKMMGKGGSGVSSAPSASAPELY
jgi:hypothetical protein